MSILYFYECKRCELVFKNIKYLIHNHRYFRTLLTYFLYIEIRHIAIISSDNCENIFVTCRIYVNNHIMHENTYCCVLVASLFL